MSTNQQTPRFSGFDGRQGTAFRRYLITYVQQFLGVDIKDILANWELLFNHSLKNEGRIQTVKKWKSFYDYASRYSCGLRTDPLPFVRANKEGFPTILKDFRPLLLGTPDARRAALTVLQLYKMESIEPPYSLSSITEPYSGQESPEWIDLFKEVVEREFPSDQQQLRVKSLKPGFHISGKSGPNGPCIGTAFVDREAIRGTNIEASVMDLASATGFKDLYRLLDYSNVACNTVNTYDGRPKFHSRISIKYEPGGKARPFAICDFFTQSALNSIHRFCMNWLKSQVTDGTAQHSRAAQTVRKWSANPKVPLWSYDLTSATDRFPIFLQEIVVKQMFGNRIGELWKDLISNRTFKGPKGEMVRFATGQPLGALSSWAVFAITHHLLLQTAARESFGSKSKWFKYYRMIGDDICIARSDKVASLYKGYLDSLNVSISANKSVLPEQCSRGNCAELAKRLFHEGVEVTPVPPLAILESSRNLIGFKNLIESSWDRGYYSAGSPYPVQSVLSSKIEFAAFTFPVRNRCPQLNGVTSLFQFGNIEDNAPAGLNPNWFIWYDLPIEFINDSVRRFLFERVEDAVEKSVRIQHLVLRSQYQKSKRDQLPQGGDWQPGPFDCHPEILAEVFTELQDILDENRDKIWTDKYLKGDIADLYSFVGQLHKYLEPEIFLIGRDLHDEKRKTSIFVSAVIKYVSQRAIARKLREQK